MFVLRRLTGWLAWQTHYSWVACWLHACSSCDQSTGLRTWNELKSWQEKFLITTWLAAIDLVGWIATSSSSKGCEWRAASVCECAKRIWPLHAGNSLHPTNFLYLASASWRSCRRPSLSLSPDSMEVAMAAERLLGMRCTNQPPSTDQTLTDGGQELQLRPWPPENEVLTWIIIRPSFTVPCRANGRRGGQEGGCVAWLSKHGMEAMHDGKAGRKLECSTSIAWGISRVPFVS